MKLRNKKTGESMSNYKGLFTFDIDNHRYVPVEQADGIIDFMNYQPEPKGNWTIDPMNEDYIDDGKYTSPDELERYEELGLKFNTKEEAEKAVEKLKAWKRLKDKGFRFIGIAGLKSEIHFCAGEKYDNAHIMFDEYGSSSEDLKQYNKDLDLLFGGE